MSDDLEAAVAAGVLGADEAHRALLQSVVDVARAIFGAAASSIFLLEEETDELVLEAVAGAGQESLVGMRFPSGTGIAGWVLTTRQPLVVDDLSQDPRHARDTAEATGYVPRSMMAVPLLVEERALGVLYVLDRAEETSTSLAQMELLGLFAAQAAIALDLLQRSRRAQRVLAGDGDLVPLARVAALLDGLDDERRPAGLRLLAALEDVLKAP
jgi:GAF domain-containing protein